MRDKQKQPLHIEGRTVILEELQPKYFSDVIRWRNDTGLNRYINQHFVLTEEMERAWYEDVYLTDSAQGLFVLVDKETGTPFGTSGWTDYDPARRLCIWGRLMAGERPFQGSVQLIEGILLAVGYFFDTLDVDLAYSHPVAKNDASVRLNHRFGFFEHEGAPAFADHMNVANDPMTELVATRASFAKARKKIEAFLEAFS